MRDQLPVLVIGFNRPAFAQQVLQRVTQMNPSKVYFAVDGPRKQRPSDIHLVRQTQAASEIVATRGIPILTRFAATNLGCRKAVQSALDWFFMNEARGIVLEDDCVPDHHFYDFCDHALDTEIGGERVLAAVGHSRLSIPTGDQLLRVGTRLGSCWGWAANSEDWLSSFRDLDKLADQKVRCKVLENLGSDLGTLRLREFDRAARLQKMGRIDSWDYPWALTRAVKGPWSVAPSRALIRNVGINHGATHQTRHPVRPPSATDLAWLSDDAVALSESDEARVLSRYRRLSYAALTFSDWLKHAGASFQRPKPLRTP